ncbi:hypothetical protein [Prevotella sp.]|jgi:hypothetical protein|uniref:hypothetical protein n=1 Tax=Prevotella sp. TaxID=59823 RepID=UPI00262A44D3|nr:hypothetical protein [Prevotella sp.]MEE0671036.1 hypothetical protein [Prevotella sp.]
MEQKVSDNIELRSEKVRNVIGKVPPRLVSLGTVLITVIVLALALAFYKIPYPISIEATGEVINQRTVQVFVPYKYLYLFDEPRTAHVSFEGNDDASYSCNVISHNAKLIHREEGNYFMAIATVSTQGRNTPVLQKYMKADVRVIISNQTLWQQVFG